MALYKSIIIIIIIIIINIIPAQCNCFHDVREGNCVFVAELIVE